MLLQEASTESLLGSVSNDVLVHVFILKIRYICN